VDGDLALIFGFILVALWIIFRRPERLRRAQHAQRAQRDSSPADETKAISQELLKQLVRIEERVKVLERIVTDDPGELKRQFRDLAD